MIRSRVFGPGDFYYWPSLFAHEIEVIEITGAGLRNCSPHWISAGQVGYLEAPSAYYIDKAVFYASTYYLSTPACKHNSGFILDQTTNKFVCLDCKLPASQCQSKDSTTSSAAICECGADKVYGPGSGMHSATMPCPLYRKP